MLYLDTGCLLKLYYPEWNSTQIAAAVAGEEICFTELHDLEIASALEFKVFRGEAVADQAKAARQALADDLAVGKLVKLAVDWKEAWAEAQRLAIAHGATTGTRALDTLHCAVVNITGLPELLTTDARQLALAKAIGLRLRPS